MEQTIESALTSGLVPNPKEAPAIRWGILGAGWISSEFAMAVTNATSAKIGAVASRDRNKAQTFIDTYLGEAGAETVAYGSYEELVADKNIDAIYVGTPHSHHREHALLAIQAGKPVLVEKAFARNAGEATDILEAAKQHNVFAMEAMWTRHLPHVAAIHEVIASGVIGEIKTLFADHGQNFIVNRVPRLWDLELAGGALLDLGVYPIAFAHDILGTPHSITAHGTLTDTNVDEQVAMIFNYDSGVQAVLHTTMGGATPTTASIVGTKGRIDVAGAFYTPTSFTVTTLDSETLTYDAQNVRGLEFEAAEVARCLAAGKTQSDRMTWQDTMEIMQIMDNVRNQIGVKFPGE